MKQLIKTAIVLGVSAASLSALNYRYPELYKETRVMGMGGANVAVGGYATSLFYNPAGVGYIPKSEGVEFSLLNINIAASEKFNDIYKDLNDASDEDDSEQATIDVLKDYLGETFGIYASDFTGLGYKGDTVGWALGGVGSVSVDGLVHSGFGSEGMLELNVAGFGGGVFAISFDENDMSIGDYHLNRFTWGLGVKNVMYYTASHGLTPQEIVDYSDDLYEYLDDEGYVANGTSTVFDIGGIYQLSEKQTAGLSIINIGGIGDGDTIEVPMTVNAGWGYTWEDDDSVFFNRFRLAADYIDLTNQYEVNDAMKKTRMGGEFYLWDGWLSYLAIKAGLYQGSPTYGADLMVPVPLLNLFKLSYASYTEQLGAYAGQDPDVRHMVGIRVGW